ncbi:MAG: sugar MFS transporter [Sphaerochaetaceae bacterium]
MYKSTIRACYLGNFVGALVSNLSPLLFIILMDQYGLGFEQVGRLTLINFFTQIITDLVFSKPVDTYGVRPFISSAHLLATLGFVLFAFAPALFPNQPYLGFMIATVVFSCGGGLLELLLSAIIQAIPSEAKATAMSLLHSFYAWGFIVVVLGTSAMLAIFGRANWPIIVLLWSILPFVNFFNFLRVPLAPQVSEAQRTSTATLGRSPFFITVVLGIALGGAAEVSMSQWTSAYVEAALSLPKEVGDLIGLCMFAAFLGTGRALYGKFGKHVDVWKVMFWGSLLAAGCYVVAALSPWPLLSVAACSLCGLGTALLWPGSVVNAAKRFPLAGASLFALLAAGGDTGAAVGPWLLGFIADTAPAVFRTGFPLASLDSAEAGLRCGMLFATLYPLSMMVCLLTMRRLSHRGQTTDAVQSSVLDTR